MLISATSQTKESEDVGLSQREGVSFSPRAAAVNRRHSIDAALTSGLGSAAGQGNVHCLHPYQRQCSDGAVTAAGRLPQGLSSLSCLQEVCRPDTSHSLTLTLNATRVEITQQISILLKNCVKSLNFFFCLQSSYPAAPVEPSCFSSQNYPYYRSSSPLRQVTHRLGEEHEC